MRCEPQERRAKGRLFDNPILLLRCIINTHSYPFSHPIPANRSPDALTLSPHQPPHPLQTPPLPTPIAICQTPFTAPTPTRARPRIALPPAHFHFLHHIPLASAPDVIHWCRAHFPLLGEFLVEREDASVGGGVGDVSYAAAAGGVVVCGLGLLGAEGGVFDGGGGKGAGAVADTAAAEGEVVEVGGGGLVDGVGHWGVGIRSVEWRLWWSCCRGVWWWWCEW